MSVTPPLAVSFVHALRTALRRCPELAGVAATARVSSTGAVPAAAVSADGRIDINPAFWDSLDDEGRAFVVAHELMHLLLRTHQRQNRPTFVEFNYAHDAHINDLLRARWGEELPAGVVDVPGARFQSAEAIMLRLLKEGARAPFTPPLPSLWSSAYGRVDKDLLQRRAGERPPPPRSPRAQSASGRAAAGRAWVGDPRSGIDPQQIDVCVDVDSTTTSQMNSLTSLLSPHMCTTALTMRAVRSTSATSAAEPLAAMSGAVTSTRAPGLRASRPCTRSR